MVSTCRRGQNIRARRGRAFPMLLTRKTQRRGPAKSGGAIEVVVLSKDKVPSDVSRVRYEISSVRRITSVQQDVAQGRKHTFRCCQRFMWIFYLDLNGSELI